MKFEILPVHFRLDPLLLDSNIGIGRLYHLCTWCLKTILVHFRLDTTLVDFNDMHWERGDISFIFNGSERPQESLTVLDNRLGVFQRIRYEVMCVF